MPGYDRSPTGPRAGIMPGCDRSPIGPRAGIMPVYDRSPTGPLAGIMPVYERSPTGPQWSRVGIMSISHYVMWMGWLLGGSVGVRVDGSDGLVYGPMKSWWLFVGLSPGNMSGSVGM